MSDRSVIGLASIIVPCWNQVVFTRQCVAALRQHTRDPWELIVIDNGSTDGTGHYLAGVRDMSSVPVTVISNATNLGFPAAINQGLRVRGEYLVLLNNDVVVVDGWLDQLVALVNAKADLVVDEGGASPAGPSAELARECSGASPPTPPPGGGARLSVAHSASGSLGLCPITPLRPSWSKGRIIASWRKCPRSLGDGGMSTSGSGSLPPNCRGSVCS